MVKRISYPCPVLGNSEDYQYNAIFTLSKVKWILHEDNSGVTFSFPLPEINDEVLLNLFQKEEANLILLINCAKSYFQKTLLITFKDFIDDYYSCFFKYGVLNGEVTYQLFLVSNVDKLIRPQLVSEDYDDSLSISKNDILGKTPEWNELIDHKFDPNSSKATTFISVTKHIDDKQFTEVNYSTEDIEIRLPVSTYDKYREFDQYTAPILHSSIVLPVLIQAISFVKNEVHNTEQWYNKLKQMIDVRGLTNKTEFSIASILLKDPINKGIIYLSDSKSKSSRGEE